MSATRVSNNSRAGRQNPCLLLLPNRHLVVPPSVAATVTASCSLVPLDVGSKTGAVAIGLRLPPRSSCRPQKTCWPKHRGPGFTMAEAEKRKILLVVQRRRNAQEVEVKRSQVQASRESQSLPSMPACSKVVTSRHSQ